LLQGENDERPQLQFSFKLQAHGKNITYVKYCDLLVQKLDIELEEDFVDNMVNFVSTLPFNDLKCVEGIALCFKSCCAL